MAKKRYEVYVGSELRVKFGQAVENAEGCKKKESRVIRRFMQEYVRQHWVDGYLDQVDEMKNT